MLIEFTLHRTKRKVLVNPASVTSVLLKTSRDEQAVCIRTSEEGGLQYWVEGSYNEAKKKLTKDLKKPAKVLRDFQDLQSVAEHKCPLQLIGCMKICGSSGCGN